MNILNKIIENINYRSSIKIYFPLIIQFLIKKKFNKKRIILMSIISLELINCIYYQSNAFQKFANIISYSPFQRIFTKFYI